MRLAYGLVGMLLCVSADRPLSARDDVATSIEAAVLAVNAEMTKAAEALDTERLFNYVLETDKGSIIQNGLFLATRHEALERVRADVRGVATLQYHWKSQHVTVLSPQIAVLTAEGVSTGTTTAGASFSTPFAQSVVFVKRAEGWRAIHAHQSSLRGR